MRLLAFYRVPKMSEPAPLGHDRVLASGAASRAAVEGPESEGRTPAFAWRVLMRNRGRAGPCRADVRTTSLGSSGQCTNVPRLELIRAVVGHEQGITVHRHLPGEPPRRDRSQERWSSPKG